MSSKRFPIMKLGNVGLISSIPWEMIEPHRRQAEINHGQTLEELAARGGLDPTELIAVVLGKRWHDVWWYQ